MLSRVAEQEPARSDRIDVEEMVGDERHSSDETLIGIEAHGIWSCVTELGRWTGRRGRLPRVWGFKWPPEAFAGHGPPIYRPEPA